MILLYDSEPYELNATITASEEATDYPDSNLKTLNYSEVWRSTSAGAGAVTIVIDLLAATSINSICLLNTNLRSTSTVTIAANTSDSWGAPAFGPEGFTESGMDGVRRNLWHSLSGAQSYRYWRLSLTDNGNPDGFIQIGELFMGTRVELTDPPAETHIRDVIRPNVEWRTEYNQAYVYERDWHYEFDFNWENVQTATANELRTLERFVGGNARPFVMIEDDQNSPFEAYFVRLAGSGLREQYIDYNVRSLNLRMIEEQPGLIVPR